MKEYASQKRFKEIEISSYNRTKTFLDKSYGYGVDKNNKPYILDEYNIKAFLYYVKRNPKLLRNRMKYYDEEYLEPTKDISSLSRLAIMENVKKVICNLYEVDIDNKIRYVKWKNNQEFLNFQIDNFKKSLVKSKDKLILFEESIKNVSFRVSNSRKLTGIHSDIHQNNMIINNSKLCLIDWELCTIGDLAYELATHFILMDYHDEEKREFVNYISNKLKLKKEDLYNDINVYIKFEMIRRNILKGNTKNNYH